MARIWRTPLLGELAMGFTTKGAWRRTLPRPIAERSWEDFDQGTQRAILKLYRSSPSSKLAAAGAEFGQAYADALGGEVTLEHCEGGPWLERPELIERVAGFLAG